METKIQNSGKCKKKYFLVFLLISCLYHICIFFIKIDNNFENKNKSIEIDILKKYRTIGVKSNKKWFSDKVTKSVEKKDHKTLTIGDLTPVIKNVQSLASHTSDSGIKISRTVDTNTSVFHKKVMDTEFKSRAVKDLQVTNQDINILKKTGFDLDVEQSDGVHEDELNTNEKIFYAFQKRVFLSYISSFLKSCDKVFGSRNNLMKNLPNDPVTMIGKVIYDVEGNIVSINIVKWSINDELERLFESTLEGIGQIQNPPKMYIGSDNRFTMYFKLSLYN